ncbi:MAG: FAD-dependent oxidoreductase [Pseudomonadota bacterium]
MASAKKIDTLVIGSGPAGQKAAIQAAKARRSVVVVEQLREVGGACVQFGTIPSKALRERALKRVSTGTQPTSINISTLLGETEVLVRKHDRFMRAQLERNGIDVVHGRARFVDAHRVAVHPPGEAERRYDCSSIVIACGSKPRHPDHVAVDHEHVYDSDSVLSIGYLPETMLVIGGGVIACEYASIFALLGVRVTQLDRFPMPLGFLDPALAVEYRRQFEGLGGRFIGPVEIAAVETEPYGGVVARLSGGESVQAQKALCALGRVSAIDGLDLAAAGLTTDERQLVPVDENGRTAVAHIFAAGDVVGPPSLASSSMQQGRSAARALLGLEPEEGWQFTPSGIYGVPAIGSVGLSEIQARGSHETVLVGHADYAEIARGLIDDSEQGFLRLIADAQGRLLGAHAIGGPAAELVHLAQLALVHGARVDLFVTQIFNFPTFAEAYRVAALDIMAQRDRV